jgi:hypothetical protein
MSVLNSETNDEYFSEHGSALYIALFSNLRGSAGRRRHWEISLKTVLRHVCANGITALPSMMMGDSLLALLAAGGSRLKTVLKKSANRLPARRTITVQFHIHQSRRRLQAEGNFPPRFRAATTEVLVLVQAS